VIAALLLLSGWSQTELAAAFDGDRFRPAALSQREHSFVAALAGRSLDHPDQPPSVRANLPDWIYAALGARFGDRTMAEIAAMRDEAPVDLRANLLRGDRDSALRQLAADGIRATPTALAPAGLRLDARQPLAATAAFRSGAVEIQDEGSQLAAALVEAGPGMRVCDFCAGAGGKTLALAASMANAGRIVACDTVARRLDGATARLCRMSNDACWRPNAIPGSRNTRRDSTVSWSTPPARGPEPGGAIPTRGGSSRRRIWANWWPSRPASSTAPRGSCGPAGVWST
jgi:16S rRNA (cytosine967-C5)-methyltransferase